MTLTAATPKAPYTGFIMTVAPRRRPMRGYGRHLPTLPPIKLKELSTDDYWWSATVATPTPSPTLKTTTWWPPGVQLGPRPTRPHLPPHIINPKLLKWDRKFPKIWFRTGGTRFTYAPEVVNYPVTFDWHIPKEKRVDKYTEKPDWPLDSPLFGSKQVYDYLEEVTLPPPPESGETEFPITSPAPWWTFPPWWEEKIASEVNGTTLRPVATKPKPKVTKPPITTTTLVMTRPSTTTSTTTAKTTTTSTTRSKTTTASKTTTERTQTTTKPQPTSKHKTTPATPKTPKLKSKKVIHHKGPWWKLTIVEHLSQSTLTPELSKEKGKRSKRHVEKFKPLKRQNAFRRKRRKHYHKKNQSARLIFYNNLLPYGREILYDEMKPVSLNLSTLSKPLLESILREALLELKQHVGSPPQKDKEKNFENNLDIEKHLVLLHNLFTTALNEYVQQRKNGLLLKLIIKEIGINLLNSLLSKKTGLRQYMKKTIDVKKRGKLQTGMRNSSLKLFKLFESLCQHKLLEKSCAQQVIDVLQVLFGTNEIEFVQCSLRIKGKSRKKEKSIDVFSNAANLGSSNKNSILRLKRNSKIDLDEHLNFSSQSMEKVVDEIVEELPLKTLKQDLKTELISELHTNKLQKLGQSNVNAEVMNKMMEFEAEGVDDSKLDQATMDSVKKVITQLLQEVLSTLRNNDWMKKVMIKLFEDGYSVDSVVDTISEQISIESLIKSMEKEGVKITETQRNLVLSEFKDYKPILNKLLKQEVLLWEYQLSKNSYQLPNNSSQVRRRRDLPDHVFNDQVLNTANFMRTKRNVDDDNSLDMKGGEGDNPDYDKGQLDIDKELSAIEKSSMSVDKKVKKLRKHLKYLQSQTENPADIVFPDNFEEDLMRTENYDEAKTRGPRLFKKRYQWNVRTKKPTVKVVTFLPKIRLTRGKPFVPLTTTEETLIIPETQPPTRKKKPKKPIVPRKEVDPSAVTTLQTFKKHFWLDYTQKTSVPRVPTRRLRRMQRLVHRRRTTPSPLPDKTFATMRTFRTMKFGKKTQKPVISLQEFLKRRNDFRKVREEVMWNKNFMTSSQEDAKGKLPAQEDISEEEGELSEEEEEELSFDTKLSTEVKPEDFTLRPLSDFLFIRPPSTPVDIEPSEHVTLSSLTDGKTITTKKDEFLTISKVTRRKYSRKTGYTRGPKNIPTRKPNKQTPTIEKPSTNTKQQEKDKTEIESDMDGERNKRDLSTTYSLRPFTSPSEDQSGKMSSELKSLFQIWKNGTDLHEEKTHSREENSLNPTSEPESSARRRITQEEIEMKIQSQTKHWGFGAKPVVSEPVDCAPENKSSNSFETYQLEHKKWFGERRRGIPVNNFDIDWDQMRRKLEVQEVFGGQKHKTARKPFDKTQLHKYWNMDWTTKGSKAVLTSVTESSVPRPAVERTIWLDENYKPEFTKYRSRPYFRNFVSDENSMDFKGTPAQGIFEPPFGKADRSGKTAFGRLYHYEARRRHYVVHDTRDPVFDKNEIRKLVNKTYDPDFRIKTHRKTHWHNRTFDPKYVFTQWISKRLNTTSRPFILHDIGKKQFERLNSTLFKKESILINRTQTVDPGFDNYFNILRGQRVMSLRPKHQSFRDNENNTVIINKDNNTFILQRSNKVPWDNKTDPLVYYTYQRSRKRFYNKTVDIAFSYYIFHKFKCGNATRDVGYGRMSNVVNRWYNRTFVPKFRPDMFYVRNRYKSGKEFNYYLNEFNTMHAMMSEGTFEPDRWAHLMANKSDTRQNREEQFKPGSFESKLTREHYETSETKHSIQTFQTPSTPPSFKVSATVRLKQRFETTENPYLFKTTSQPKPSFFQSVKKKGFNFFKSLFNKKDINESS